MNKLFSILFLLISFKAFTQFDYELYENYLNTDQSNRYRNSKLISITEFQPDSGRWIKFSFKQFNLKGFPMEIINYYRNGKEMQKREFCYDSAGYISKIESYEGKKLEHSTVFEINSFGQVVSFTDYMFDYPDQGKSLSWKSIRIYNSNGTLSKSIKLYNLQRDTVEIVLFDTSGVKIRSLWHYKELKTGEIKYLWNKDKSEMKEVHYEENSIAFNTITHKYKNNKEIERIDPATSPNQLYWKYDSEGRIIETNELFFYVQYFKYNKEGYLENISVDVLSSDSKKKTGAKRIESKYEYQFRN